VIDPQSITKIRSTVGSEYYKSDSDMIAYRHVLPLQRVDHLDQPLREQGLGVLENKQTQLVHDTSGQASTPK